MKLTARPPRDPNQPDYLRVALQKTNIESMQAIHYIAKRLRKLPKQC
jgi:tRNA(Glu) U13 pseudouridine synthase TruD